MATPLTYRNRSTVADFMSHLWTTALAFVVPLGGGFVFAWAFSSALQNKNFPWITGRALGIAGYLALSALVALGIWLRHPWRFRCSLGHAETRLRAHATLGIATVVLIIGHLVFLATDRYAGVGWIGAIIPGLSHYRRAAVGLGVGAFELLLVIAATARFAGRRGAGHWLAIHRLATLTFALTWFHGVFAGTDTAALRVVYVTTGSLVAFLLASRALVRPRGTDLDDDATFGPVRQETSEDQLVAAHR
jgi:DMSO/TMAO reductase YedYZ heme-binding membrane subunit